MPFQDGASGYERASAFGHATTVQHPLVQGALARYQMPQTRTRDAGAITERLIEPQTLDQPDCSVEHAVATDGSYHEAEVDPAFPSTRVLFMQMGAVIVDLKKLARRSGPFVDPGAILDAQSASVMASMLPSSNLVRVDGVDPKTAFRQELDEMFRTNTVEGRSLLDVLLSIEAERTPRPVPVGYVELSGCPSKPVCTQDLSGFPVGPQGERCPGCGTRLLAVDALRVHEAFKENGSNVEACSRAMSLAERLISMALLERVAELRPSMLQKMTYITDGPLALMFEVAPIKRPLLRRMQKIAADLRNQGLGLPVIIGAEKGGQFAEHGHAIRDYVPEGRLMVLDDHYTQTYITFAGSTHGRDTYYGRHFFYRAMNGQMYTITVPPLGHVGAETHGRFDPDDYPTLRATCSVLDRIGTRLYQDATIPVALAHKYVAYPLVTAGRVLKLHAEDHLDRSQAA
jgi:hypothetical protein